MVSIGTKKKPKFEANRLSPAANRVVLLLLGIYAAMALFPLLLVGAISVTEQQALFEEGYRLIPRELDFSAYGYVIQLGRQLVQSYLVTTFVTVAGTVLVLLSLSMYAYVISRRDFPHRLFFTLFGLFTILFDGGIVAKYMINTQVLGLKDSIWALILPLVPNGFFLLILKGFFSNQLPDSIIDSAKVDGAGEFRIFFQIVTPLSVPALGTIGLFSALRYWNDWFLGLLYIDSSSKTPLQYLLMRLQGSLEFLLRNAGDLGPEASSLLVSLPPSSTRMAMVLMVLGPIVFAYGFFQKYFRRGLVLGSVKG